MNNKDNKLQFTGILSGQQMEAMLPDYALGKLPDKECKLFEQSLPSYPALEQEAAQIRKTLGEFDVEKLRASMGRQVRNLSVDVNQHYQSLQGSQRSHRRWVLRLLPLAALGMMVIFVLSVTDVFYFNSDGTSSVAGNIEEQVPQAESQELISTAEVAGLLEGSDESEMLEYVFLLEEAVGNVKDDYKTHNLDDETITEQLLEDVSVDNLVEENLVLYSDYSMDDEFLGELREDELQYLIMELDKNVVL